MSPSRRKKCKTMRAVFTSPDARRRTLGWLVVIAVFVFGSSLLVRQYLPWLLEPASLRLRVAATGPFAPAVFVGIQAMQVIIAPIPGQALGFASGYLFGTVFGTAYSLLGAIIGSYVVFRLSRRYGRQHVERAIDPAIVAEFDTLVEHRGLAALFAVFLVPGLPDDVICFVAGLTDLRIRDMLVVSAAGRFPGYLVVNAAGAELEAGDATVSLLLLGLLAVFTVLGYVYRSALLDRLAGPDDEDHA
jgi:uncharacterized membrane protein YdjX (TVP38/TMEM64 family)